MLSGAGYSVKEFHIYLSGLGERGLVRDGLGCVILRLSENSDFPENALKTEIRDEIRRHDAEVLGYSR